MGSSTQSITTLDQQPRSFHASRRAEIKPSAAPALHGSSRISAVKGEGQLRAGELSFAQRLVQRGADTSTKNVGSRTAALSEVVIRMLVCLVLVPHLAAMLPVAEAGPLPTTGWELGRSELLAARGQWHAHRRCTGTKDVVGDQEASVAESAPAYDKRREYEDRQVYFGQHDALVAISNASDQQAQDGAAFNVVGENGSTDGQDDNSSTAKNAHLSAQTNTDVPGPRWGHTSAYLPFNDVVLFVGGQVDTEGRITNDVFALDVSSLRSNGTNATSPTTSSNSSAWSRLTSAGLPPHAFAASAVTQGPAGAEDERLWLIGGVTQNCAADAPVWTWSAPANASESSDSWRDGSWSAVEVNKAPVRRRGAQAIPVPAGLGLGSNTAKAAKNASMSLMVLGGTADESVCFASNSTKGSSRSNADYYGVDIWTMAAVNGSRPANANDSDSTMSLGLRSLALESGMRALSLVDYAAVVLPGRPDADPSRPAHYDRVMYLGGRDKAGSLTPFDQFWVLELKTGRWEIWNATGTVPTGRIGHSATRTPSGQIVIHGGYTNGTTGKPTDELFVLDPSVTPARWSRPTYSNTIEGADVSPARAYHSAVMTGDIMVVGFGNHDAAQSQDTDQEPNARQEVAQVHYLDTSNQNGWAWSDSMAGVLAARQANAVPVRSPSSAKAAPPSPVASAKPADTPVESSAESPAPARAPADTPTQSDAPKSPAQSEPAPSPPAQTAAAHADHAAPPAASPSAATAQAPAASKPANNAAGNQDDDGESHPTPSQRGAIAGSVLGAAALAGVVSALYAYRRRRNREDEGTSSGDLEGRAPPVSALWLQQPKAWASAAGRGLKRRGSAASSVFGSFTNTRRRTSVASSGSTLYDSTEFLHATKGDMGMGIGREDDPYTSPTHGVRTFQVLRSIGRGVPRAPSNAPLPKAFISSLVDDDDDHGYARQTGEMRAAGLAVPFVTGVQAPAAVAAADALPRDATIARVGSSESLVSSFGSASHFSYPYLAAMHRPSLANLSNTTGSDFGHGSASTHGNGLEVENEHDRDLERELSLSPRSGGNGGNLHENGADDEDWDADAHELGRAEVLMSVIGPDPSDEEASSDEEADYTDASRAARRGGSSPAPFVAAAALARPVSTSPFPWELVPPPPPAAQISTPVTRGQGQMMPMPMPRAGTPLPALAPFSTQVQTTPTESAKMLATPQLGSPLSIALPRPAAMSSATPTPVQIHDRAQEAQNRIRSSRKARRSTLRVTNVSSDASSS